MKMIKSILLMIIASFFLFASVAHAQRHKHETAERTNNHTHIDPKAHVSVFDHYYIGAGLGYNKISGFKKNDPLFNIGEGALDISGISFDLFAGKRFEIGRGFFVGAEAFYQGDTASNEYYFKYTKHIDVAGEALKEQPIRGVAVGEAKDVYGLQAIFGFEVSKNILFSANVGYSWSGIDYTFVHRSNNIYIKTTKGKKGKDVKTKHYFLNKTVTESASGSGLKFGVAFDFSLSDNFLIRLSGNMHKFKYDTVIDSKVSPESLTRLGVSSSIIIAF